MGLYSRYDFLTGETTIVEIEDAPVEDFDINSYRALKRAELNAICEAEITTPYQSSTIIAHKGKSHRYSTDRDDQRNMDVKLNIVFNTPTLLTQLWKTKDDGVVLHTRDEFITIALEIVAYIEQKLFKCIALKMQLDAATTKEQIDAINW